MQFWNATVGSTAIALLVWLCGVPCHAQTTEADREALRAQLVSQYQQVERNQREIRDNEAGLEGLAKFTAQYQQLVGADLERITQARSADLARCDEILDVYHERKTTCIDDATTRFDEQYAVLVERLTANPLDFAGEPVDTFNAYSSKTRFSQMVTKEYKDTIAALHDENNRLRHEISVNEMLLNQVMPIIVVPPDSASLDAGAEADRFPQGGSIFETPEEAARSQQARVGEEQLFPDGGSIRQAGSETNPADDGNAAMRTLGAGATGFDRGPVGPAGDVLEGFWRLGANDAVFQVFSIGGQYNGKVVDAGQSANLTAGQVVWYGIHRPPGETLWTGNGLFEDQTGRLKISPVRFDLAGNSMTVYDPGSDPFELTRTGRPR